MFILVLSIAFVNSEEDWDGLSNTVVVDMNVDGIVDISNPQNMDYLEINLNYFPKETDNQRILSNEIYPSDKIKGETDEHLYFLYDSIDSNVIQYGVISRVEKTVSIGEVKSKVLFPIGSFPKEYDKYVLPTETIDSDEQKVIELARSFAEGEDDLYVLVNKIAYWVNKNIEYDLTSASVKASLSASWVLKNREGVCDEITNLFVALVRALGIPARFISGVSYTSADYLESHWGPHGWAEVYFPGHGWIPFDVTYGEYGYVDPTHIILSYSLDATDDSTSYRWTESGSKVTVSPLDINTELVRSLGDIDEELSAELSLFSNEIGIGSYNLVELEVTNHRDSYVSTSFYLVNVDGIDVMSEAEQDFVIEPNAKKKIYWIVQTSKYLEKGYLYTVPIKVSSYLGTTAEDSFVVHENAEIYSNPDFAEILATYDQEEEVDFGVDLNCRYTDTGDLYVGMPIDLLCDIKNTRQDIVDDLNLCLRGECKELYIEPEDTFKIKFKPNLTRSGAEIFVFYLNNSNYTVNQIVNVPVYDLPNITITDVTHPYSVAFEDIFNIQFMIKRESHTVPQNVNVLISHTSLDKKIFVDKLQTEQELIIKVPANSLDEGENTLTLFVKYEDTIGNKYVTRKDISIALTEMTFMQKAGVKMRGFIAWLGGLFE